MFSPSWGGIDQSAGRLATLAAVIAALTMSGASPVFHTELDSGAWTRRTVASVSPACVVTEPTDSLVWTSRDPAALSAEVAIARRLLASVGRELLPEVEAYIGALEVVLPEHFVPSRDAAGVEVGLRVARATLEQSASTLGVWVRIAAAIAPEVRPERVVPRRFVVVAAVDDDTPETVDLRAWRDRSAISSYLESDDDPSSGTA